jgi:UrcA family protein
MKALRLLATFVSALAVTAVFGSGAAFADDSTAVEPESNIDQHIYAVGEAIKFEEVSVTVPFGDLNLNNEKGAEALYRRLQIASESVCGVRLAKDQRCLRSQRLADDCYHRALTTAVDSVGSEMLASIHQGTEPTEMFAAKVK